MTTDVCQNGWPVIHDIHTDKAAVLFMAAGRSWWAANADVAIIAGYLLDRIDNEVEPISTPGDTVDDWSWADRPIRGMHTGFSNHAGATAWDVNAKKHPRGKHGTWTPQQIGKIVKILADLINMTGVNRPVIRWGELFRTAPIDGMHFELVADALFARIVANKIRGIVTMASKPNSFLSAEVELTATAAHHMPGLTAEQDVTVEYLLLWGGATAQETLAKLQQVSAQLATLTGLVQGLVDKAAP